MRWLVLWILLSASVASADTRYGVGLDVTVIDLHAQSATEFGLASRLLVGGRIKALGELELGQLSSTGESLGFAANVRIGARVRAITFDRDADLVFDAGVGLERVWPDDGASFARSYGFAGWGTQVRNHRNALELSVRILASPTLENSEALRVICRGLCPPSPDLPPLDLGVAVAGTVLW